MQGVDMAGGRRVFGQAEQMRGDIVYSQSFKADQFVQGRQGGGELGAGNDLAAPDRNKGAAPARVRAVVETQALRQAQRVQVHLPAGGAMGARGFAENL